MIVLAYMERQFIVYIEGHYDSFHFPECVWTPHMQKIASRYPGSTSNTFGGKYCGVTKRGMEAMHEFLLHGFFPDQYSDYRAYFLLYKTLAYFEYEWTI